MASNWLLYLDSFLSSNDKNYIHDSDIARKIVSYGFRGVIEEQGTKEIKQIIQSKVFIKKDELSVALGMREELIKDGKLDCVLFLKRDGKSAFIDVRDRIDKKLDVLRPLEGDLAYFNWNSRTECTKDSTTFQVIVNEEEFFIRHVEKRNVVYPGQSDKVVLAIQKYDKVIFYDIQHSY